MPTYTDYDGLPKQNTCECCSPQMRTMTATTPHKWTKKEIEEEIFYHVGQLMEANWWNRGERLRRLKHWMIKLETIRNLS